jgi:uncharacterized protein (TIGR00290 family)
MHKAYMNWSGGKDSALALYKILQQKKYVVDCLLTSVNAVHNRISMHGVRRELLQSQAASMGLPLTTIELPEQPSMSEYEEVLEKKVIALKEQHFTHSIFGDIFLEDLKLYREEKLHAAGLQAVFPLWKIDTKELIVCVNERFLDKSFCGRVIDKDCINDFPANVDVCGENGEFHTFVFDGPIFKEPVSFNQGEIVRKEYKAPQDVEEEIKQYGFWFCDLLKA